MSDSARSRRSPPVIEPGHTYASVSDKIGSIVLSRKTPLFWIVGFFLSFLLAMALLVAVSVLFAKGLGIWGINQPVEWAFDIINFVWWIGIGHAGTLISAILLLLRQEWRTSINRFAEAMTIFAVMLTQGIGDVASPAAAVEGIAVACESRRVVLTADCKGHGSSGKIEQVAVEGGVVNRQLILAVFPDELAADNAAVALKDSGIAHGDAIAEVPAH